MAWFRILYTRNAFERSLGDRAARELSPAAGMRAMAAFYRDHRAQHAEVPDGDDVLEFRWATVDDEFEVAILRRLRRHGSNAPERVLALRYRFARTERRDAVGAGQFATDDPADVGGFLRSVTGSAAWTVIAGAAVRSRSLDEV